MSSSPPSPSPSNIDTPDHDDLLELYRANKAAEGLHHDLNDDGAYQQTFTDPFASGGMGGEGAPSDGASGDGQHAFPSGAQSSQRVNPDYAVLPLSLIPGFEALQMRLHGKLDLDATAQDLTLEMANANSFQEIGYIVTCVAAKIEQRLRNMEDRARFSLSSDLKKSIALNARVLLLSAKLTAYRSKDINEAVFRALKTLKAPDLPGDNDITGKGVVLKEIGAVLSNFRCELKKAIIESIPQGSSTRNIAALTSVIISPLNISPMLTTYTRIAWLRSRTVKYLKMIEEQEPQRATEYWVFMDQELAKWKEDLKTQPEMDAAFTFAYEQDKSTYGPPTVTQVRVLEPNKVPDWMVKLDDAAKTVLNSAVPSGSTRAPKRKRTARQ
ncbi:hypothetical protein BD626DRAFT_521881 [Schizophyllum amplum]|uniref:Uncharacterized protein n=1 Tax=Schizophyllum amplum TaxID=97359 RepID=A0A550BTF6_9AGAR|nr:hypothetical protein BD626DRAFT_521881 [Auriculariopsis ampla]